MQSRNITPQFKLIRAELTVPPYKVRQVLHLTPKQQVYLIERIQIASGEPIAVARGYWCCEIGARLAELDLNRIPLYEIVETTLHTPLIEADESISAASADADLARKLSIARHAPLLVRRRLTYTTEMRPIEFTTTFYRGDQYEYKVRLSRYAT
jgi:GntR family transcriptional regulator